GLILNSRFRAESMAVPGNLLVSMVLLLLALIAATWPLMKFRSMRATERVPRRAAEYFWLSMLGTIAMITVFVLHLASVLDIESVDANLESLAGAIEKNFEAETTS